MRKYIIGRKNSKILVDIPISSSEDTVGRQHFSLNVNGDEYYGEDLGSKNGSFIQKNGVWTPFSQGYLKLGDTLKLGDYVTSVQNLLHSLPNPPQEGKPSFNSETGEFNSGK